MTTHLTTLPPSHPLPLSCLYCHSLCFFAAMHPDVVFSQGTSQSSLMASFTMP